MPLVAVAALPHTPQLLVRPETEDRDLVLRVHAAYGEIKQSLAAIRPDVICIIGGDHIEGFFLTSVPAHAVYVPLHFAMPEPRLPIVPLYVNVYLPPQPTPARCYAWGQALRAILDARPERIALLASGGLSHFPGTDRYASPDYDWDRQILDQLVQGRGNETAALTAEELDKAGNVEFRTWITLLGAVGDAKARVICYEPSWHHGNAVVTWPVA